MWTKKGSDECLRVALHRARCDSGLGGSKGQAAEEKDVVRPPSTPSSAPLVLSPALLSPFCPSMGPLARQVAAEDRRLRLEKALLTFGEWSRIWLLTWSLLFSGKSFSRLGLVPVRVIYSPTGLG